jgi:outer membrane protein assembly factor BamB
VSRRLALTAALLALAACTSNRSTVEPPAALLELPPSTSVSQVWAQKLGIDAEDLLLALAPTSDGQRVYTAERGGSVQAWDLATGRRVWRSRPERLTRGSGERLGLWNALTFNLNKGEGQRLAAGPSLADGMLVTGSSDGEIAAFSADDGRVLWNVVVPGEILAAPAVGAGVVIVRTGAGSLYALEARDGAVRWQVEQPVPSLSLRGNAAPILHEGRVYAGFDNGKLAAYDLQRGVQVWETALATPTGRSEIDRLADLDGVMRVTQDEVVAAGLHGRVALLASDSGRPLWQRDLSSSAGVDDDGRAVYVTDQDSLVWALDRRNGGTLWTQDDLRARKLTAPVRVGALLAVGDLEGWVHLIDPASGEVTARVRAGGGAVTAPPLAVLDLLLVQTSAGELYAFRVATAG